MRILCLDTATDVGSIALVEGGRVLFERSTAIHARLGDTLLGEVEDGLSGLGLDRRAIELCAVGLGPGSFTGLRVGLAMAKGLHLGLGIPLVGLPTARTLAGALAAPVSVVAIDARKEEAFIACYRRAADGALEVVLEDVHGPPAEMGARARAALGPDARPAVAGTGATEALCEGLGAPYERAAPELDRPRAALMAAEAEARFRARGPDDPAAIVPRYVRGADVTVKA